MYSLVICSPRPRTHDTALAIAGRVDRAEPLLDVAPDDVITVEEYFALRSGIEVAAFIAGRPAASRFAHRQLGFWRDLLSTLSEGECALIVTHGANVELPAVALALELGVPPLPVPVQYIEGVRVHQLDRRHEVEPLPAR